MRRNHNEGSNGLLNGLGKAVKTVLPIPFFKNNEKKTLCYTTSCVEFNNPIIVSALNGADIHKEQEHNDISK